MTPTLPWVQSLHQSRGGSKLRYRLLHTAARITRGQRKVYLRLPKNWPWALALARAFQRLRHIPLPI